VTIASRYNTNRMVKEYYNKFYKNASGNHARLSADNFAADRELVKWKNRIKNDFAALRVENIQADTGRTYKSSEQFPLQADLYLGRVDPADIRVEAYYGNLIGDDMLHDSALAVLGNVAKLADGRYRFSGVIPCAHTGNFGFKLRVTPFHPLLADSYEMGLVLWG